MARQAQHINPRIVLDNGRGLYFVTEETEIGEYGTLICITKRQSYSKYQCKTCWLKQTEHSNAQTVFMAGSSLPERT